MTKKNGNGEEKAPAVWGDRAEIRDIAGRCEQMIPGIIKLPSHLRTSASLAMAQISVMAGLNPFIGELWPIPTKSDYKGDVDGFQIMVGVKGLRRVAKVQAKDLGLIPPYYRPTWRWPTEEEKEAMALNVGDVAIVCELELFLPPGHPYFSQGDRRYTVEGIGLVRSNYKGKMEKIQAARKRAESDALKMSFDIPLGSTIMDAEYEAGDWIEVRPESGIPTLVNRADPDVWDNSINMMIADGIIKTPLEVQDALAALKITYLDNDNFFPLMGRVVAYLEDKKRDESLPVEPKERGRSKLFKEEEEEPLPRGAFEDPPRREPGDKAAQAGEPTSERPFQGRLCDRAEVWDPEKILGYLQEVASSMSDQEEVITRKQRGLLSGKGRELFAGQENDGLKWHSLLLWSFGVGSTGNLKKCQANAWLDLILDSDRGPDGDYQLHPSAPEEAERILRVRMEAQGQADMFKDAPEEVKEKGEHDDVVV